MSKFLGSGTPRTIHVGFGLWPIPDPWGPVGVTFRFREKFPSYQTLLRHPSSMSTPEGRTVNSQAKGRCHKRKTITSDSDLVRISAKSPTQKSCTVKTNSVCKAVDPKTFRHILSLALASPVLVRSNCRSKKFGGSDHWRQDGLRGEVRDDPDMTTWYYGDTPLLCGRDWACPSTIWLTRQILDGWSFHISAVSRNLPFRRKSSCKPNSGAPLPIKRGVSWGSDSSCF